MKSPPKFPRKTASLPAEHEALAGSDADLIWVFKDEATRSRGYNNANGDFVTVLAHPPLSVAAYTTALDLVDGLASTDEPIYAVAADGCFSATSLTKFTKPNHFNPQSLIYSDFELSPKLALLLKACNELGHSPRELRAMRQQQAAPLWNKLAEIVRKGLREPEFKKQMRRLQERHDYHEVGFRKLVDGMFTCHAKLCCVRVDLGFRAEHAKTITASDMKAFMAKFKNNTRSNACFKDLVGYILCYECGVDHGMHCHCTFFFDGSKVRNDVFYARRIIEYWETTVTQGKGLGFNCNKKKAARYRWVGIGNIHYSDTQKIEALLYALSYFYKVQLVLVPKALSKLRTIEHTQVASLKRGAGGRPRGSRKLMLEPVATGPAKMKARAKNEPAGPAGDSGQEGDEDAGASAIQGPCRPLTPAPSAAAVDAGLKVAEPAEGIDIAIAPPEVCAAGVPRKRPALQRALLGELDDFELGIFTSKPGNAADAPAPSLTPSLSGAVVHPGGPAPEPVDVTDIAIAPPAAGAASVPRKRPALQRALLGELDDFELSLCARKPDMAINVAATPPMGAAEQIAIAQQPSASPEMANMPLMAYYPPEG